ncbi:MAG: SMP-30/gluconolactonase/LRE family protein [Pirellulaceae bacterium]
MPQEIEASVLFVPETEALRFLPEGPYRYGSNRLSWVAITHAADATSGSLNVFDFGNGSNRNIPLTGRPGFAFPTNRPNVFVVGMERSVDLVDIESGEVQHWIGGIDAQVEGTIINDGVTFDGHLVFGCKELTFSKKIAGLYLLRQGEQTPVQLLDNQICSNGKAVRNGRDGVYEFFDICSPSQQVLRWMLDTNSGKVSEPQVVVDLVGSDVFPDGMIMTPDEKSLIVAIYDPRESNHGEARQYSIATGQLERTWICPASPRVTCPQLIERNGRVELLLTTADEGMSPELRSKSHNAGALFVGETGFDSAGECPVFELE